MKTNPRMLFKGDAYFTMPLAFVRALSPNECVALAYLIRRSQIPKRNEDHWRYRTVKQVQADLGWNPHKQFRYFRGLERKGLIHIARGYYREFRVVWSAIHAMILADIKEREEVKATESDERHARQIKQRRRRKTKK